MFHVLFAAVIQALTSGTLWQNGDFIEMLTATSEMQPALTLCLVFSYLGPGLPNPTMSQGTSSATLVLLLLLPLLLVLALLPRCLGAAVACAGAGTCAVLVLALH